MNIETPYTLIEKTVDFKENCDGLLIKHEQHIPDWFLDSLREERNVSASQRMGDFCRVASVPEVLVDKWRAEGFDIFRESASAIVARLKAEDNTKFLTTDKRV
jgi:hypothetical protein